MYLPEVLSCKDFVTLLVYRRKQRVEERVPIMRWTWGPR